MKTKTNDFLLDEELLNVFREVFSEQEFEIAVTDAKRAFAFIRKQESKQNNC